VGLRKELLADVAELRRLFDLYMGQLANLSGPDAEAAMKAALEAVDQLDGALSLEKVRVERQFSRVTGCSYSWRTVRLLIPRAAAAAAGSLSLGVRLLDWGLGDAVLVLVVCCTACLQLMGRVIRMVLRSCQG
jgi:hypothetical protein